MAGEELNVLRGSVEAGKVRDAFALATLKKHFHEGTGLADIDT